MVSGIVNPKTEYSLGLLLLSLSAAVFDPMHSSILGVFLDVAVDTRNTKICRSANLIRLSVLYKCPMDGPHFV